MKLNPTYRINLGPPIFQWMNKELTKPIANLSPFTFGPGQPSRYLLTDPAKRILPGTIELPLKPVSFYGDDPFCFPDWEVPPKILERIKKEGHPWLLETIRNDTQGEKSTLKEIQDGISRYHEAHLDYLLFTEVGLPITGESIEELKTKDNEELSELIQLYLTEGLVKDNILMQIFKALLLFKYAIYRELSPLDIVSKAPHGMIFTNTKLSKSYTASKTGFKVDDYSSAGLFGFGTADKPSPGQLTGAREAVFFDEIRDKDKEGILTATKSYEESGFFRTTKGGYTIETPAYSPLIYMGNNEQGEEDATLQVMEFAETLDTITKSPTAFGSRKGFVYFTLDGTPKSGKPISDREELRELNATVHTILILLGEKYESIITMSGVEKWIYEKFPDWYTGAIQGSLDKFSYQDKTVKDFWKGHMEAYLHTKLYCINLSILDYASDFLNDKPPESTDFLERCNYHHNELFTMNLNSLKTMVSLTTGHEYEIFTHGLKVLTPEYLKNLVIAVYHFLQAVEHTPISMEYSLEEIGRAYQSLDKKLIKNDLYHEFRRIKEKIPKNTGPINGILESKHGFRLINENGVYFVRIKDPRVIKENNPLFHQWVRSGADGCDEQKPGAVTAPNTFGTKRTEPHPSALTHDYREKTSKVYTSGLKSILCNIFGDDSDITREKWHKAIVVISETLNGNRIQPEVFQQELSRCDINISEQEEIKKILGIREVGAWLEISKEGLKMLGVNK